LAALGPDQRGGAAIEFAISAPVLIMLSLGTVEIGRVTLAYHDLSLATFEAGRYAMVHGTGSDPDVTEEETRAAITTLVESRLHGVDTSKLELSVGWDPDNNPGGFVTISLSYPFNFLVGFVPDLTLTSDVTVIVAN
jgi:Flp pilus assembly protein TadG